MASRQTRTVRDAGPIPGPPPDDPIIRHPPVETQMSVEEFNSKDYHVQTGIVLVLNNKNFQVPNVALPDRMGTDIDASIISQRFRDLGFEDELETDLNKAETISWFERVKTDLQTNPVDCFVLVILSHGTENGFYARDQLISFKEIVNHFGAINCVPLRFKPKIIITQCCRGDGISEGIPATLVSQDPNQPDARPDPTEYNEYVQQLTRVQTINLPNEADFLFSYATIPGGSAFRNVELGTPFIRLLSQAMERMEVNEDFLSVLTTVNKTVGMTYKPNYQQASFNTLVQMPCFVSQLTKTLRFLQR